jgi:molybdopterin synthase sulfur carrier subunit
MSVTVRLPPVLRVDVGGARTVELESPGDLRGALTALVEQYPGLRQKLLDGSGDLNRFVNVYVEQEDVRLGNGLDTSLADGTTVIVLPAMAGGGR